MKENKITVPVYRQLKCGKSVIPKIYGLPKLHKSGIPHRPIVSFIGAPTYQLSKFLVNVLSPLLTYDFSINNSKHFVQRINEIQCDDNDFLVSFDVISLFTSIPVPNVLRIIENLLLNDAVLGACTKLQCLSLILCLLLNCVFILQFLCLKMCFIIKHEGLPWGLVFHWWLPILSWSMLNAKLLLPFENHQKYGYATLTTSFVL